MQRHAQRHHHHVLRKRLPVEQERDEVMPVQPAFLEDLELVGGRPNVAARAAQPKRLRDRFSTRPIVAAAQPVEEPPQDALVGCPRVLSRA